jgi:hypothetical protein
VTDQLGSGARAAARRPKPKEDQMSVVMVRQKVKDDSVQEAEAAARELFATLDRLRPEGLRSASTRVVASSTFVILTELADGNRTRGRRSRSSWGSWRSSRAGWTDHR